MNPPALAHDRGEFKRRIVGGPALRTKLGWLIHKDLLSESRSWQVWPETVLLGTFVAVLFGTLLNLPEGPQRRVSGPVLWFAIVFAGLPSLERCFATEREDRCLDGLLLSCVMPGTVYFAKLIFNMVVLAALACLLIPLWAVLMHVPLLAHPLRLVLVVFLGNLGIASAGTILSALVSGFGARRGGMLFLLLPLVLPVVIAAAESTRLLLENDFGPEWNRWVQFLAAFAVVFLTAGSILFEYVLRS